MYHVSKVDSDALAREHALVGHSSGFHQQSLVDRTVGSPHMNLSVAQLDPGGHVDQQLHSYEKSVYVLDGAVALSMNGRNVLLGRDHCAVIPVGTTHALSASASGARWLQMSAPGALLDPARRTKTFFPRGRPDPTRPEAPSLRDPRTSDVFRFDDASMDLAILAKGSRTDAPTVSASMATALLAYSGIGVRMLVDQRLGAQLHTMFMVDYQPSAIAHPHDHPFEESYFLLEGEVEALVDGDTMTLGPGDVLWAGVGCDHGFRNRSSGRVRWIETQAPQPPSRHSYRFSRDWEYLADTIDQSAETQEQR